MSPTIPLAVRELASEYTSVTAVHLSVMEITESVPPRAHIQRVWRVDLPGAAAIEQRRLEEYRIGHIPTYTQALLSVFIVQSTDGKYYVDGGLYDVDPI